MGYLRPSEATGLTPYQFIPPSAVGAAKHWAFILFPEELEVAGKTGEFNESVILDWAVMTELHPLMLALKKRQPANQRVWRFDQEQYAKLFSRATELAGLAHLIVFSLEGLR